MCTAFTRRHNGNITSIYICHKIKILIIIENKQNIPFKDLKNKMNILINLNTFISALKKFL